MSLVFRNDPFGDILRLQRALERSISKPYFGLDGTPSGRGIYPALNAFEEGDALVVKAEMPGIDREKLQVEIEGNQLMVAGARKVRTQVDDSCRHHRRERSGGEFRRVFRLPFEVDVEASTASYTDGILTVRLEKAESAKPRQIAVQN